MSNPSWIGQSGNWNSPGDWGDNGFVPGATASPIIDTASPVTVTIDTLEFAAGLTIGIQDTLQLVNNPAATLTNTIVSSLAITGTVNVSGLIVVNSTIADPTLTFTGPVSIASSGEIDAIGGAAVINFAGDLVTNLGTIAASNGGTITFSGVTVIVPNTTGSTGSSGSTGTTTETIAPVIDNGGTIMASAGGVIVFDGATINNFDLVTTTTTTTTTNNNNTTTTTTTTTTDYFGTIETTGAGSDIQLVDTYLQAGTIETGSLTSSAGGEIEIVATTVGANISIFDGSTYTMTVDGFVQIDDGASLALLGTFDNLGTIADGETTSGEPVIDGTVTLDGSGAITLEDSGAVVIGATSATGTLIGTLINDGNTISGSGTIEDLTLENDGGAIKSNGGGTLTLDADSVGNAAFMGGIGGRLGVELHRRHLRQFGNAARRT